MKMLRIILLIAAVVWIVFAVLTGILPAKNFRLLCIISQSTVAALCLIVSAFLPVWTSGDAAKEDDKHD